MAKNTSNADLGNADLSNADLSNAAIFLDQQIALLKELLYINFTINLMNESIYEVS